MPSAAAWSEDHGCRERHLNSSCHAPAIVRRWLEQVLGHAIDADAMADLQLVGTELVDNTYAHRRGRIQMRLGPRRWRQAAVVLERAHRGAADHLRVHGAARGATTRPRQSTGTYVDAPRVPHVTDAHAVTDRSRRKSASPQRARTRQHLVARRAATHVALHRVVVDGPRRARHLSWTRAPRADDRSPNYCSRHKVDHAYQQRPPESASP